MHDPAPSGGIGGSDDGWTIRANGTEAAEWLIILQGAADARYEIGDGVESFGGADAVDEQNMGKLTSHDGESGHRVLTRQFPLQGVTVPVFYMP